MHGNRLCAVLEGFQLRLHLVHKRSLLLCKGVVPLGICFMHFLQLAVLLLQVSKPAPIDGMLWTTAHFMNLPIQIENCFQVGIPINQTFTKCFV
jgi:hypothetical protein